MEVPDLIKNASETTATTLSHIVGDMKDRLDDVKDRIDTGLHHRQAPPPKKHFPTRAVLVFVGLALVAVMSVARRCTGKDKQATEHFTRPEADREPTADEARAAERAANGVDVAKVGRHYEEMNERGANVAGEGQVEPASTN